ncbi:mitochondrial coenzyme A transporter SLC25A42 isoform X2 [Ctenocephalides felis]|uniref:mitochondrial coenzyme A transporter SLC25A42 isoform X2 n=1 Tax=Ctenocephalides felis TaxID=7515 RepID=UPI000E6E5797|nr:mitochondrial coenzyme A transporter SLC25A42 isoform X2 [Ctenocephalides felis]
MQSDSVSHSMSGCLSNKPTITMTISTIGDNQEKNANKSPADEVAITSTQLVLTSLCAGAIAGAIAKTAIAPLDRTKINFQISKAPYSMKSAWRFLCDTYKNEGVLALWRGNSATMARIIPYAAIQFTAHEQWKRVLKVDKVKSSDKNVSTKRFLAGSLAGITSQSLTYPLDLARARMAVTQRGEYRTLRQVFARICREEGAHALYRGYWATILGVIPYAGVSFFTYDTLKHQYKAYTHSDPSGIYSLLFGAIAGVLGQTSSYPLDIVRRRMQTARLQNDGKYMYVAIMPTLKLILRNEGFKHGFYKGLTMNWIKGPVAVGISFASYDTIKDFLRNVIHLDNLKFR